MLDYSEFQLAFAQENRLALTDLLEDVYERGIRKGRRQAKQDRSARRDYAQLAHEVEMALATVTEWETDGLNGQTIRNANISPSSVRRLRRLVQDGKEVDAV